MNRGIRASLALALAFALETPVLAQVRPVVLPSLSVLGVNAASVSGAAGVGAPAFAPSALGSFAAPQPLSVPAAFAAPSIAVPAAPAAAVAPALASAALPAASAPVSSASKSRAAAPTVESLKTLAAQPAGAPALSGYADGKRQFDGAAMAGPAAEPAAAPAPAPRGATVQFNGQSLPTRMFSDQTQISGHLIRAIDATKSTLDVAIYELALREVRDALVRARQRGVKVRIVLDQGHVYPEKEGSTRTPEVQSLIDAGFELKTLRGGDQFGIMHNKFAVFDGKLMETGSYNWTRAADTQHFENALFDDSASRIASYQNYWNWMWSNARTVDLNNPPVKIVLDEHGKSAPLAPAPQDAVKPLSLNGTAFPRQSFTPHGTAALIAAAIDAARDSVDLANFSFTHADIVAALQRAKDRGLRVRLIFDRYQYGFLKEMQEMGDLGFDVRLSSGRVPGGRGVMHNKFGVFDGKLVETGSFNWTFNGELNNYENAAFLDAPDDVDGYSGYFDRIWKQGQAPTDADRGRQRHDAGEGLHPEGFNPHAF